MLAAQPRDLDRLRDTAGEDGVRLENVVAAPFDHRPEFGKAGAVELAAGDRHPAGFSECLQILIGVHGQRFFDPCNAGVGAGIRKPHGAVEVPGGRVGDDGHPATPGLASTAIFMWSPTAAATSVTCRMSTFSSWSCTRSLTVRKPSAVTRLDLFDSSRRVLDLAGRGVETDRPRLAAEQLEHRLALDLALDVPEGGFDPPVAPPEVGDLAKPLLHEIDVGRPPHPGGTDRAGPRGRHVRDRWQVRR